MKKIRYLLLLATILIILVGVVSASEVSEDNTETSSVTVPQDTYKTADTASIIKDNKIDENIRTSKASIKKIDKSVSNTTVKSAKKDNTITNWQQLSKATDALSNTTKKTTLKLGKGTYITTDTIKWSNTKTTLTIDGNGQTIDGNKQQLFIVENGATLVLKNINIKNADSEHGGAIVNRGTLTITQATLTGNTGTYGGAIENHGTLTVTQSTLTGNKANNGGAIENTGTLKITNSTLSYNSADYGGAIDANAGSVTVTQSTLTGNRANDGGAIENSGTLKITNSALSNNTAEYGGTIYNDVGTVTIIQSTLTDNTAYQDGGAVRNTFGTITIIQSTLTGNRANDGGAIDNYEMLSITNSTLNNNTANNNGGAVSNDLDEFIITGSNFTGNHAGTGAAIFSHGNSKLTHNTFTNNTADNKETIDLYGYWNGHAENNLYKSTDISFKTNILSIKDNQTIFADDEDVVLNYSIALTNPQYYDSDIPERLNDITVYVNDVEYATTGYENYTLSGLDEGEYTVYITTCNSKSNTVTFTVIDEDMINVTTWDVEMVQARGVTLSAIVEYKNSTINQGQVYFEIDGKALSDENGSILYAPVINNRADLPYDMPEDISLGNHTLTAVYLYDDSILATDNKTLTIIENIPEGAGGRDDIPSEEGKQGRNRHYTRPYETIHLTVTAVHEIIAGNTVIPADNVLTLGELGEIFNRTFTNGHLLVYVDGELVYNGTVGDDLTTVILQIIEKFLGKHEIKVEFTDSSNQTKTYTENVSIS